MAGVGFNASQAWQPEVYVKYGIINRIPCTVGQGYQGTFKNGTVVSITGNYQVNNTIIPPLGPVGIAVAQNQVDYTNPVNLSVSVMIPTPGAVVSLPVSCFASGSTPDPGDPIYVTTQGVLTTTSTDSFNASMASSIYPFAQCIASDQEYIDVIFPLVGQASATAGSSK
ncbi:MAG: hypothetical protein IIZ78_14865 [Clostridiales bacterium]|nr:hypothetical protein [Clostridiales bacterium]